MTKTDKTDLMTPRFEMTREQLAALGRGEVAYVRSIDAGEVKGLLGDDTVVPDDAELFCLYLADGTPVSITDSRAAAVESAEQHDLKMISVH